MFDVAAEELRFLDGELPELVAGSHAGHASGNAGQDRTAQFALILGRGLLAAFLGAIAVRGFLWGDLHWLGPGRGLPRLGLLEIATAAASPTLGSNLGATRRSWRGKKLPEVAVRHRGRRGGATAGALGLGRRGEGVGELGRERVGAIVHTHGRCPELSSRRALGGEGLSLSRARVSCFETSMRGRKCQLSRVRGAVRGRSRGGSRRAVPKSDDDVWL